MQRKHNGFVLLIMMIFLQLFAMLSIRESSQLALLMKQIKLQRQCSSQQMLMMRILDMLDQSVVTGCNQAHYSYHYLQQQSLAWWQQHACAGIYQQTIYYYVEEDLGTDNCAVVSVNNNLQKAHYYRHALFYPAAYTSLAQDVLIKPEKTTPECTSKIKLLNQGRQTLRWLY